MQRLPDDFPDVRPTTPGEVDLDGARVVLCRILGGRRGWREGFDLLRERCRERGVAVAFHPHLATYVESPAETEAVLERLDGELVGLCLDTGHTLIGGGDPVALGRDWGDRVVHVHLKDVEPTVLERVRGGQLDVDSAWAQGLFCPFGEGAVDLPAFLSLPWLRGFAGVAVLEQDRVAVRLADLERVQEVEAANLELVRRALGG
jgi:inosose dehydratase